MSAWPTTLFPNLLLLPFIDATLSVEEEALVFVLVTRVVLLGFWFVVEEGV